MVSNQDLVASFSPDVRQFAFQTNVSQKNIIDIYPLDSSNDYNVNSSLVSHIDYESNDLRASDIFYLGWVNSLQEESKQRVKRRNGDENGSEIGIDSSPENFFVNVVSPGKIVVFSSSGKDIVNIIQTKSNILHVSLEDAFIWLLDDDKTVKKLQYNQAKQIKSFHIVDGKNEEIIHFNVLKSDQSTYLCYASEDTVYVIDPSKRRPTTLASFPVEGCLATDIMDNGKLVVAHEAGVSVFDLNSKELAQSWKTEVRLVRCIKDIVLCLIASGETLTYRLGVDNAVCAIKVVDSHIIELARVNDGVMIAWLNVNEPNFKLISLGDLNGNDEIIINDQKDNNADDSGSPIDVKTNPLDTSNKSQEEGVTKAVTSKRVTKAERDKLSKSLAHALNSSDNEQILEIVCSTTWNEQRIKSFVINQLTTEQVLAKLYEVAADGLQKNPWESSEVPGLWIKWILTLKGNLFSNASNQSKHSKKLTKHLRASLKASGDCLPVLLGIQGRLEMLKRQSQLREEIAQLSVEDDEADEEVETVVNDEIYANGESDTFVDASEFRNPV